MGAASPSSSPFSPQPQPEPPEPRRVPAVQVSLQTGYVRLLRWKNIKINNDADLLHKITSSVPTYLTPGFVLILDLNVGFKDKLNDSRSAVDSDSEEDEPPFYLASERSGRTQQSAPRPSHNLSLLSLTVIIGKGRLQARTDRKVSQEDDEFNERALMSLTAEYEPPPPFFLCVCVFSNGSTVAFKNLHLTKTDPLCCLMYKWMKRKSFHPFSLPTWFSVEFWGETSPSLTTIQAHTRLYFYPY